MGLIIGCYLSILLILLVFDTFRPRKAYKLIDNEALREDLALKRELEIWYSTEIRQVYYIPETNRIIDIPACMFGTDFPSDTGNIEINILDLDGVYRKAIYVGELE